jgi:flagellar basal-body rod modification protein FlgD
LLQEDFLKLMTTQLQNQDPFKPMESGEFLGQIAQFGTVSGINELKDSFNAFSGSITSNQALQASMMVGRNVSVSSDIVRLEANSSVNGSVELPQSTDALTVEILDEAGQVIRRVDLGPTAAGSQKFSWDGTMDDGTIAPPAFYAVRASARIDGGQTALETLVDARVESVTLGKFGQGPTLNVAGVGSIGLDEIKEIK